MDTSKALPDLTQGITTDSSKLAHPKYLAEQTNMQTVIGTGLVKRPPLVNAAPNAITGFTNTTDVVANFIQEFEYKHTKYFLHVNSDLVAQTVTAAIFDESGTEFTLEVDSTLDYLKDTVTKHDIQLAVHGDTIFVVNRKETCRMNTELRESNNVSLIHVKQAPEANTELKVTFVDSADVSYTATYTTLSGLDARGTNLIAFHLATAINTLTPTDTTAYYAGSTVAIVSDANQFSKVTTQDEANNNVLTAINGTLANVLDLPRWAIPTPILAVKPDADSTIGAFYVVGIEDVEVTAPTPLTPDVVVTAGYKSDIYREQSGFSSTDETPIGSITPDPFLISGHQIETIKFYMNTLTEIQALYITDDAQNYLPEGTIGWIIIKKSSDDTLIFEGAPTPDSRFPGVDVWLGVGYIVLEDSEDYDVYVNQSEPTASELTQMNWEETSAAGETFKLDPLTMPHTLVYNNTAEKFTFDTIEWDDKNAGDSVTNTLPTCINTQITDIGIFQNRLALLIKDEIETSETDNLYSLFKNTVTQKLPTHPVRIRSTSSKSANFTNMLNHNKDLLLMTPKAQFKLPGNVALTPQTAGLPLTTTFNVATDTDPISLGSDVLYRFKSGNYSGLAKYVTEGDAVERDNSRPLTNHVRKLIPDENLTLLGNPNTGVIYAISESKVFVCVYDTELTRAEDARLAWSVWNTDLTSTGIIEAATLTDDTLTLLVSNDNDTIDILSLDAPAQPILEIYLDFQETGNTGVNTTVPVIGGTDRPVIKLKDVAAPYAQDPQTDAGFTVVETDTRREITSYTLVQDTTDLYIIFDEDYENVDVTWGYTYDSGMTPQDQYVRDSRNAINSRTTLTLRRWEAHMRDSAGVTASIDSPWHTIPDQTWSGLSTDDIESLTDEVPNKTGTFKISYGLDAAHSSLNIHSDNWLPMTIEELEWFGNYNSKGRRL